MLEKRNLIERDGRAPLVLKDQPELGAVDVKQNAARVPVAERRRGFALRCHEQLEVVQGGHRLEGSLAVIVHLEGADVMRAG